MASLTRWCLVTGRWDTFYIHILIRPGQVLFVHVSSTRYEFMQSPFWLAILINAMRGCGLYKLMPKIINTVEFKSNLKRHTTDIVGYYIVANENSKNKSFVVMDTEVALGLFIESGHPEIAQDITNALNQVNQKVSEKYSKIRKIRSIR